MADHIEALRKANELLDKALKDKSTVEHMRKEFTAALSPLVDAIKEQTRTREELTRVTRNEIKRNISQLQIPDIIIPAIDIPDIVIPEIKLPDISVPEAKIEVVIPPIVVPEPQVTVNIPPIKVPKPEVTVNVPKITIPDIIIPETKVEFPSSIKIDADRTNPIPVILTDGDNRTYSIQSFVGGGSGARIQQYAEGDKESLLTGIASMAKDVNGALFPLELGPGVSDKALRVIMATDSMLSVSFSSLTSLQVSQISGTVDSVNVLFFDGNSPALNSGVANSGTLRVVHATDVATSVNISGFTTTIAANLITSDNNTYDSRDRNWTITEVVPISANNTLDVRQVSGSSWSTSASIDAQTVTLGVNQVSGSVWSTTVTNDANSLIVNQVSGSSWSTSSSIDAQTVTLGVNQVSGSSWSTSASIDAQTATLDVKQVSGSIDSINVLQFNGNTVSVGNGEVSLGTLRVAQASDLATSVSIVSNIASLDVIQVSGSIWSVAAISGPTSLDVKQVSGSIDSINVLQLNGNPISTDSGITTPGTLRVVHAIDVAMSTNIVSGSLSPQNTPGFAPTNTTTGTLSANLVIKAGAGNLYGITGYNNSTAAQFIQIHNANATPADGAVPVITLTVPGSSNFSLDFGVYGRNFSTGIAITNSTTVATKTVGGLDCWFDAQFL